MRKLILVSVIFAFGLGYTACKKKGDDLALLLPIAQGASSGKAPVGVPESDVKTAPTGTVDGGGTVKDITGDSATPPANTPDNTPPAGDSGTSGSSGSSDSGTSGTSGSGASGTSGTSGSGASGTSGSSGSGASGTSGTSGSGASGTSGSSGSGDSGTSGSSGSGASGTSGSSGSGDSGNTNSEDKGDNKEDKGSNKDDGGSSKSGDSKDSKGSKDSKSKDGKDSKDSKSKDGKDSKDSKSKDGKSDSAKGKTNLVRQGKDACYVQEKSTWFRDAEAIFTYDEKKAVGFCFQNVPAGKYNLRLMARHWVSAKKGEAKVKLPRNFKNFKLAVVASTVDNKPQSMTVPASDKGLEKGEIEVDLVGGDVMVMVAWENGAKDVNFSLHQVKLSKVGASEHSALAGYLYGMDGKNIALLMVLLAVAALGIFGVNRMKKAGAAG